ncbi:phage antirepressor KilAC domain-containing protein [Streptosporangium sp. NBC_01755]|uniref:phage antirepressor n=1 Tax=unclassified Streptosporangium TaxID=2632669 RepID=UPI002DDA3621|nr:MULTISPECIES: phage antirepressor KilAC domain-containing protein [unclassified Streptosporangium]WSA23702.1 phage antirepressor KilAC domain-containing protein [Streptosporangium sp. NBC_01810]WSD03838.1 phage antirepressor KilAC domain-containing protein [Streptosporangium sp. NBC_01755]
MHNGTSFNPEDDNRGENQELQIFDNGEFHLEITIVGDSFIVNAPGLAKALGNRDASNMLANLDEDEKGYFLASTPGGEQTVWHAKEPGFYRLIGQRQVGRIKNPAVKDQVERFQRWVFHDVIPSIRKTGQYRQQLSRKDLARQWYEAEERAELEAARADREHAARMIEAAGREAAEEEIQILGPKAAAADHHRSADGLMTLSDFANKLKAWSIQNLGIRILQKDVFDFLGEIGLICRGNTIRNNRPKSFATDRDFIREKETEYEDKNGNLRISYSSRLTPPGDGWAWDRAVKRLDETGSLRKPLGGVA